MNINLQRNDIANLLSSMRKFMICRNLLTKDEGESCNKVYTKLVKLIESDFQEVIKERKMNLSEICSKCHKDGLHCECENFHPNIAIRDSLGNTGPEIHWFSKQELQALYGILENQYIHYDNIEAHKVVTKIAKIIYQIK